MTTLKSPYHHGDLRAVLIAKGTEVLAECGPEGLSLREVARRAGVSHNAPSRHFPTREALLAAIAARGFQQLSARLEAMAGTSGAAMLDRGLAYVAFALDHPALFRLMFSGLVDPNASAELDAAARISLGRVMSQVEEAFGPDVLAEATFAAWSTVHGLAHLLLDGQATSDLLAGRTKLQFAEATLSAMGHALAR